MEHIRPACIDICLGERYVGLGIHAAISRRDGQIRSDPFGMNSRCGSSISHAPDHDRPPKNDVEVIIVASWLFGESKLGKDCMLWR